MHIHHGKRPPGKRLKGLGHGDWRATQGIYERVYRSLCSAINRFETNQHLIEFGGQLIDLRSLGIDHIARLLAFNNIIVGNIECRHHRYTIEPKNRGSILDFAHFFVDIGAVQLLLPAYSSPGSLYPK